MVIKHGCISIHDVFCLCSLYGGWFGDLNVLIGVLWGIGFYCFREDQIKPERRP